MARVAEALAKAAGAAQGPAAIRLPGGLLQVERLPLSRLRITAVPTEPGLVLSRPVVETALTWPLVDAVASSSSVTEVGEELARYEDPALLDDGALHRRLDAYLEPGSLEGQCILDYRCGRGLSANWLAKTYPNTEIIGLDPEARWMDLAKRVAKERNVANVAFHVSLPENSGGFRAVVMGTVDEDQVAALWAALAPGGILLAPNPAENRSRVLRQIGQASAGARPVELRPRNESAEDAALSGGFLARLKARLFGGDPRAALPELAIRKDV